MRRRHRATTKMTPPDMGMAHDAIVACPLFRCRFMTDSFDLSRYFSRIGYDGPVEPTLDVLRRLHLLHPL